MNNKTTANMKRIFKKSLEQSKKAGTSTKGVLVPGPDIEQLVQFNQQFQKEFVDSFIGVPVQVDESLTGNQYYIAVSKELLDAIPQKDQGGS